MNPDSNDLLALARKYRALAALRRADPTGETAVERAALQAVAHEFPGALRELDTLPLEEIERRAEALERAGRGGSPVEPWMAWMHGYSVLMRAALAIKGGLARRIAPRAADADAIAARIAARFALPPGAIDGAFVRALARPPDGRISVLVFERLGARFGVPANRVWDTLFPPRRTGRY